MGAVVKSEDVAPGLEEGGARLIGFSTDFIS